MSYDPEIFKYDEIRDFISNQFPTDETLAELAFRMRKFKGFPGLRGSYQKQTRDLIQFFERQNIMPVLLNILAEEQDWSHDLLRKIGWDGGTITDPSEWVKEGRPYTSPDKQTDEPAVAPTNETPEPTPPAIDPDIVASDDLEFVDFNISITSRGIDREYSITAKSIYGSTATESIQTLPNNDEFLDAVDFLRTLSGEESDAKILGRMLYNFLFPRTVQQLYDKHQTRAKEQDKEGLRVRIELTPSIIELTHIPWEYCHDGQKFIAIDGRTPFVRYVRTDGEDGTLEVPEKVRLLVILASPNDMTSLNVTAEQERIEDALGNLIKKDKIELQILSEETLDGPVTRRSVRKKVRAFKPHIIHFSGHGKIDKNDDEGGVVVQNRDGTASMLDASALHALLQTSDDIRLFFLSACQTAQEGDEKEKQHVDSFKGVATRLVDAGVKAVVAMQFEVPEDTAITITENFYEELSKGQPIDAALTEARFGAYFDEDDRVFWAIPVLYMSSTSGKIW